MRTPDPTRPLLARLLVPPLLLFGAVLAPTPAAALSAVHPLTIHLETTSDWAKVELEGVSLRVLRRDVTTAGEVQPAVDGFGVRKPGFDTTPVTLRAECLVVLTGEVPRLVLTRGDVGQTRAWLRAGGRLVAELRGEGKLDKVPQNRAELALDPARLLAGKALPRRDFGKKVLAFYYGWWGSPQGPAGRWQHWDPKLRNFGGTHTPALGRYDSADPQIVEQQVAWARQAGLDGLVMSWWHSPDPHQAAGLRLLLDAAARHGLQVSAYLEVAKDAKALRAQIEDLAARFGGHPAWLKVAQAQGPDLPVLFAYGRVLDQMGKVALRQARTTPLPAFVVGDQYAPAWLESFDGAHTYVAQANGEWFRETLLQARAWGRLHDRLVCASVIPGYDDTTVRTPGWILRRDEGRTYAASWEAAALADWVLVTSWNEWHEGSDVAPSLEHGRRYLEWTRAFAEQFRRGEAP